MKKFCFALILCFLLCGCSNNNYVETKEYTTEKSEEYQQGEELANKWIEEMESIDWEENYDKAEEKGKETAEFLNQLFEQGE